MKRNNVVPALAALAFSVATLGTSPVALAAPKRIELPADDVVLKLGTLPGYAKAQAICAACHSAEYMQYQPPTAPRAYWDAMAKRMKLAKGADCRRRHPAHRRLPRQDIRQRAIPVGRCEGPLCPMTIIGIGSYAAKWLSGLQAQLSVVRLIGVRCQHAETNLLRLHRFRWSGWPVFRRNG
jgi:hypothetical protein